MWSFRVVAPPPLLVDDLILFKVVEDLTIQEFIPEAGIEPLAITVLKKVTLVKVSRPGTNGRDPVLDGFCHKLRSIV